MADIFANTELNFGGAFVANKGIINCPPLDGILMQNLQLQYSQNVSRIYELGKQGAPMNVYYIGGRSQGTANIGHVLGPSVMLAAYYQKYTDVCKARDNSLVLDLGPGSCGFGGGGSSSFSYTAKYCVLTSVGLAVNANDLVVNTQSQMMFGNLQYTGS